MSKKKRTPKRKAAKLSKPKYKISSHQKESLDRAIQAQSINNLGLAESEYRTLIAGNIKIPRVYSQLGVICALSNRIDEAKTLWLKALQLEPDFIEARMSLGDVYKHEQKFEIANAYFKKVIADNPNFVAAHLRLSLSLFQLGKIDESEASCRKAIKLSPTLLSAQDHLVQLLMVKDELVQAVLLLNNIIAANPEHTNALYMLANIYKSQGKIAQASENYQTIISKHPEFTQAHLTYSSIHKYIDKNDPHFKLMMGMYQNASTQNDSKIHLAFSLAKALEDIKDYPTAFKFLEEGNQLRFQRYNYQIDGDKVLIQNIISKFTKAAIAGLQVNASNSTKPIFIVGMPRSGTSLIEKILSSHSEVYGAGELDYFFKLGTGQFLNEASGFLFNALNSYSKETYEQMGRSYIDLIAPLDSDASYVVDKLPFNMLLLGLIKIALPNAKIIHCVRDAKDTCLSVYKQSFATDNYQFAYDLKTLGQYHNQYKELMAHWHEVMPGDIIDINYESLTDDPETEIRKLIDACGLEWQDDCLHFDKTESVVKTASAYQVRQPMYKTSVSLWKKYEEFLEPLIKVLDGGNYREY